MERDTYFLHRDGLGRCLLQASDTGIIQGLLFPAFPGESARAFSYDYGSIWYFDQILNIQDFPEFKERPFFTIESYNLDSYFKDSRCQSLYPLLGPSAKLMAYSSASYPAQLDNKECRWQYQFANPNGSWRMPIFSIWVNEQGIWTSNRDGWVLGFNHQGELVQQYKLPASTRFLTDGEESPLVSCEDGQIYELTGKVPEPIYQLKKPNPYGYYNLIFAFIKAGHWLLIADMYGQLLCLNENLEVQWQKQEFQSWQIHFLGADQNSIYQGYYKGLISYEKNTGKLNWELLTDAPILSGLVLDNEIILGCSDRQIYRLSTQSQTKNNEISVIFTCSGMPYSITSTSDQKIIFVSDSDGNIYCLDQEGHLKETLHLKSGAAMALQSWKDSLYVGTSEGVITCFNLSQIDKQLSHSPNLVTSETALPLEETKTKINSIATENSVILECIKQGKKLKIRPLSHDYHTDWNVAFPHHLRMEGSRYQVSELKESKSGKFYRVIGEIKPL